MKKTRNKKGQFVKKTISKLPADLAKKLSKYTPKQAAFFFWYSVMGNRTRAALKVYYPDFPIDKKYSNLTEKEMKNYVTADAIATGNLEKHRNPLQLYLDQHGLDFSELARKLKEGLEATKTTNAAILLTKDGKTIKAEEQGLIEVPDHPEQRAWWDRFAKLLGIKLDEEKSGQKTQVNVFNKAAKNADEFIDGEEVK